MKCNTKVLSIYSECMFLIFALCKFEVQNLMFFVYLILSYIIAVLLRKDPTH